MRARRRSLFCLSEWYNIKKLYGLWSDIRLGMTGRGDRETIKRALLWVWLLITRLIRSGGIWRLVEQEIEQDLQVDIEEKRVSWRSCVVGGVFPGRHSV